MNRELLSLKAAASALLRPLRKHKLAVGISSAFMIAACSAVTFVAPNQFALSETVGIIDPVLKQPGVYAQVPFFQFTHRYRANTQRIEFSAGGARFPMITGSLWASDTGDRNLLLANVALNYKVEPNAEKLAYWRWGMRDWSAPDGYWIVTGFLNDSANAVLGRQSMAAALADPSAFTRDLYKDLLLRFKQNNVPVSIESLELKNFTTRWFVPTRSTAYRVIGPKAADAAASAPKP